MPARVFKQGKEAMLNAKEVKALLFIVAAIEANSAEARKGSVAGMSAPDDTLKKDPNSIPLANEAGLMMDEFYPRVLAAFAMNTPEAYPDPVVVADAAGGGAQGAALAGLLGQLAGVPGLPAAAQAILTQLVGKIPSATPTTVAGPGKAP